MTAPGRVLVVAGEPSGDLFAAEVLDLLDARAFGMGGPLLRDRGLDAIASASDLAVMGLWGAVRRFPIALDAYRRVLERADVERPGAALLVGFSEFNARLGRALRRLGTRVLWYGPPQVWAWRPGRAARLAHSADVFATILPFENRIWSRVGVAVHHVGHPAFRSDDPPRAAPVSDRPRRVVLLPGSRSAELRRHLPRMLDTLRHPSMPEVHASLVLAHGLPARAAEWARSRAASHCEVLPWAPRVLWGFDAALAGSGTVTADCAAAGVPPVTVYRTDPLTFAIARRLVDVAHVGLPNLALGRRAFPELLQDDFTPANAARALAGVLDDLPRCAEDLAAVRRALSPSRPSAAHHVAELLRGLVDARSVRPTAERAGPRN